MSSRWRCLIGSLTSIYLCLAAASGCAHAQPAESRTRTINVDVTLQAPAGTGVEGVAIAIGTLNDSPGGVTDANGRVRVSGLVAANDSRVYVQLMPGTFREPSVEAHNQLVARYKDVIAAHAFELRYRVDLVPNQSDYSLTIVGGEAVRAQGKVIFPSDSRRDVRLFRPNNPFPIELDKATGQFTAPGLFKGRAGQLLLTVVGDTRVIVVDLTATQTQSDFMLPDIVVPERPTGCRVDLTMTNREAVMGSVYEPTERHDGITLVSADGLQVHRLSVNDANSKGWCPYGTLEGEPRLPCGLTYYVCPGEMDSYGATKHLLDVLRTPDGAARLDAAHAIKLVVPAADGADPVHLSFDAKAAEDAILSVK